MLSHYKSLLSLGLPIMIGQLGMIVLSFADTMMVGWHSTYELGAASFVNNIMNLVIIFGTGFSYGLTPVVGALFGRDEKSKAGEALRNSIAANLIIAVFLIVGMLLIYINVERLGQPTELLPLIKPYFLVLTVSLIFVMVFNAFKQFADGITDTKTSMWILLGGNLLNIVGNYLLIYGKMGLPEWGLFGAGVSTLLSRIVMVAVFFGLILRSKRYYEYRKGFLRGGFSRSMLRRLNSLGLPVALQMGMETASFSLSVIMVGWLGTIALASHQVMLTVAQFTFMTYYGLGAAVAIRVSNFHGQQDWQNVKCTVRAGFHLMIMLEVLLSTVIFLLRHHIGGWFTDNAEVSATVLTLLLPFFVYQFGDGLQITFANTLRGLSDVKYLMVAAFISYFVLSLPLGYVFAFPLGFGLVGIWMAFPFGLTSTGVLLWLRYRRVIRVKVKK